jgi:hypothetical protein
MSLVFDEDHNDPVKLAARNSVGGYIQSILFARAGLRNLEIMGLKPSCNGQWVIHDYGCADGFGTVVLASEFYGAFVKGIDISTMYINRARELFPTLSWEVGDICDPQEDADIIWSSHTLEHLKDPPAALGKLIERARLLVVSIFPEITAFDRTHEGAMPTTEFQRIAMENYGDSFVESTNYITLRKDVRTGNYLKESNVLVVFRGKAPV